MNETHRKDELDLPTDVMSRRAALRGGIGGVTALAAGVGGAGTATG